MKFLKKFVAPEKIFFLRGTYHSMNKYLKQGTFFYTDEMFFLPVILFVNQVCICKRPQLSYPSSISLHFFVRLSLHYFPLSPKITQSNFIVGLPDEKSDDKAHIDQRILMKFNEVGHRLTSSTDL